MFHFNTYRVLVGAIVILAIKYGAAYCSLLLVLDPVLCIWKATVVSHCSSAHASHVRVVYSLKFCYCSPVDKRLFVMLGMLVYRSTVRCIVDEALCCDRLEQRWVHRQQRREWRRSSGTTRTRGSGRRVIRLRVRVPALTSANNKNHDQSTPRPVLPWRRSNAAITTLQCSCCKCCSKRI